MGIFCLTSSDRSANINRFCTDLAKRHPIRFRAPFCCGSPNQPLPTNKRRSNDWTLIRTPGVWDSYAGVRLD